MPTEVIRAKCCAAGGGPAGMMLGWLLARAGVDVVVLEKHADFLREFRGDTIHPSTLQIVHELGLLDEFLRRPHQEAPVLVGNFMGIEFPFADFRSLPTECKFIALMPQWDFLDFVAEHAKQYPTFHDAHDATHGPSFTAHRRGCRSSARGWPAAPRAPRRATGASGPSRPSPRPAG